MGGEAQPPRLPQPAAIAPPFLFLSLLFLLAGHSRPPSSLLPAQTPHVCGRVPISEAQPLSPGFGVTGGRLRASPTAALVQPVVPSSLRELSWARKGRRGSARGRRATLSCGPGRRRGERPRVTSAAEAGSGRRRGGGRGAGRRGLAAFRQGPRPMARPRGSFERGGGRGRREESRLFRAVAPPPSALKGPAWRRAAAAVVPCVCVGGLVRVPEVTARAQKGGGGGVSSHAGGPAFRSRSAARGEGRFGEPASAHACRDRPVSRLGRVVGQRSLVWPGPRDVPVDLWVSRVGGCAAVGLGWVLNLRLSPPVSGWGGGVRVTLSLQN